jgi:DNA-binding LacI/PurR family transcriptional regulator
MEQQSNSASQQRRLQMADIARLAGVSKATVSRALNRSPLVNEETRERILDLARSLKYTINISAQNLRLKQNRTIGVVIPYDRATRRHLTDPFFLSMLGSLADALTAQGCEMLLSRIDADDIDAVALPYDTGRVMGVILVGQWRNHAQLNALAERGLPIVVWGARLDAQRYCTVGGDNLAGGALATRHLLAQGRRRIAFFGDTALPEVAHRYQGYCAALQSHGIAPEPALHVSVPFMEEAGGFAVEQLLARGEAFDGVFAASDLLAMMAINKLRAHGLRTPADVAVVGYDDIELSGYFHPPLTTVRQPMAAAGQALVASLLALAYGGAVAPVQLPAELIVRQSCGAGR